MKKISFIAAALFAVPFVAGCSASDGSSASDETSDTAGAEEALGSGGHYCPAPYTGGHSSSPQYMYSGAHAAMLAAGVGDGSLIQTFGDAPASVGTHCPEPGVHYSDATDIDPGSNPCGRVHALRMHGFAAFYRTPPAFGYHIHMVYAGAPVMKQSLKNQLASFYARRNGLVSNAIESHCPITQAEIDAVRAVADHKAAPTSGGGGLVSGRCFPGGYYCGGDRISGNASTLYRCDSNGTGASVYRTCANGCRVNAGTDDSCR